MDGGDAAPKRRRIIAEDEEIDEEVTSNPDDMVDNGPPDPEEEDGEDLEDMAYEDYVAAPELDRYEAEYLAEDGDVGESYLENLRFRQAADEEIEARNERLRRMQERDEGRDADLEGMRDHERDELEEDYEDEDEEEGPPGTERRLNLDAFDCRLQEWIAEDRTRREIESRFKKFLTTFYPGIESYQHWERKHKDDEEKKKNPYRKLPPVYPAKIRAMCADNSSSLEVSYGHLGEMQSLLAIWLTDVPRDMLKIFDEVLQREVLEQFPHYKQIAQEIHVRIVDLPISDRLRDLRQADLNNLIRVSGVVTRRSGVSPQLKAGAFRCINCGNVMGPFEINDAGETPKPSKCPSCDSDNMRQDSEHTVFRNYQKITLQESPGSVPPGRVPRYKDVVLLGDLIDIARPGEEVDVTGIYLHESCFTNKKDKSGFPVFGTVIEANCVQKKSGVHNTGLSDEDKRLIKDLSRDPKIGERIIRSIAPSIYGHRHVKTAVALSLFGGCAKESGNGTHRIRGDINILLLGDPGTAKSQVLKYAEKTAPRSIYTTGKGASAVGLTAGVHKDPNTKEWTLEGGALVLADQGVCLIDEFDKMNEQDRTSIHEAMEQQTISVSKAGIVTSLQARCAVIAAANPIGGRYDPSFTLAENVELTDPILQRFDILCVLQDVVDPVVDEQLANFVVRSHMRSHPEVNEDELDDDEMGLEGELGQDLGESASGRPRDEAAGRSDHQLNHFVHDDGPEPLDQDTLRKYIVYARAYVKPELHLSVDTEKISNLYSDLRTQSAISGGVPIAVRHIESVMRMAQASARMNLREHVRDDDVDLAIKVRPLFSLPRSLSFRITDQYSPYSIPCLLFSSCGR
jgi:DNA replication licensing factor MCM2